MINFKQIDSVKQQERPILQDSRLASIDGVVDMGTQFIQTSSLSSPQSLTPLVDDREDAGIMPLLNSIQGINEAPNVEDTIAPIVMQICEAAGWDYGEIWIPSANSIILELTDVFHIASNTTDLQSLEQFRLCSEGFVVSPGEGLPGRVWSSGQSESIADATADSESYWLRNQLAKAFDLSAGLGVPIIENGRVVAVLVFFQLVTQQ
ncbi:GAF domain-containing protein [Chamaesiphon minutus]|uniref:GAF domain-containing protein n=1 Tax=Chamaesiphon minutus TaxID=1173032 RepID=UPI00030DAE72|nr:GAF domain-containing protein [Chamaesiphon minutus]